MILNLLYVAALALASPWILYRVVRQGRYRRGAAQKLFGLSASLASKLRQASVGDSGLPLVWIHAVSVGEVQLLPGFVKHLEARANVRVVLSVSTDSGYDLAVDRFGSDRVFFCPLDFSWAVKRTIRNLGCDQLILTELELWPNLIGTAHANGIPIKVINARLSERSDAGYRRFGWFTKPVFEKLHTVCCQDQPTADRFVSCGAAADAVEVTGSIKFDNAPSDRQSDEVYAVRQLSAAQPEHVVWVVGSTSPGEETLALEVFQRIQKDFSALRLVIVPRHRERFEEVARLVQASSLECRRRSHIVEPPPTDWHSKTVLLVDTIGELKAWWGLADIATVGGSFGDRGGQNMIEPAGYGAAVSFGPDTRNFRLIANELVKHNAAQRVTDSDALETFVRQMISAPETARAMGKAAQQVVAQHRGAIDRTLERIVVLSSGSSINPSAAAA